MWICGPLLRRLILLEETEAWTFWWNLPGILNAGHSCKNFDIEQSALHKLSKNTSRGRVRAEGPLGYGRELTLGPHPPSRHCWSPTLCLGSLFANRVPDLSQLKVLLLPTLGTWGSSLEGFSCCGHWAWKVQVPCLGSRELRGVRHSLGHLHGTC